MGKLLDGMRSCCSCGKAWCCPERVEDRAEEILKGYVDCFGIDDYRNVQRMAELSGLLSHCSQVDWSNVAGSVNIGLIFRGKHVEDDCDVVVSVLKRPANKKDELSRYVQKEVGVLAINFPNIIRVVDYFSVIEGEWAYSMALLKWLGGDGIVEFFTQSVLGKGRASDVERDDIELRRHPKADAARIMQGNVEGDYFDSKWRPSTPVREGNTCVVGDYEMYMDESLGKGQFGEVYRGKHIKEGYHVAMKIIKAPAKKGDETPDEISIMDLLGCPGHPNVVKAYGTYETIDDKNEPSYVLVLELCEGGDLKEYLAKHDPLSEAQARRIMRQLVDCLCFLRERGVMHRDLKPANILLTSCNIDEAVVKVADWGMAKVNSRKGSALEATEGEEMFESAVGTMAYMAPERLNFDSYDYQAEVWALGVIMYELLFARHPYIYPKATVCSADALLGAIARAEQLDMTNRASSASTSTTDGAGEELSQQEEGYVNRRRLSPSCYELLRQMLHSEAKKRCTIIDVKNHVWFTHEEPRSAPVLVRGGSPRSVLADALGSASGVTLAGQALAEYPSAVDNSVLPVENCEGGRNVLTTLEKRQTILALREYIHILQYNIVERERDPGRGLVLLSYGWDLLSAAVNTVFSECSNVAGDTGGAANATNGPNMSASSSLFHDSLDDLKQVEGYIQTAASQLKQSLQSNQGTQTTASSAADNEEGVTQHSFTLMTRGTSLDCLPSAKELMLRHAVDLIRWAASEQLMLTPDDKREKQRGVLEAELEPKKLQGKKLWEDAMAILRLLLQQVVVYSPTVTTRSIIADATMGGSVQVLNVPLVPLTHEEDRRTVQALLHKVEGLYRNLFVRV